jgi:hypothetical protein
MKHFLLLGLLAVLPTAGFGESFYSERVYRDSSPAVQRVTTVRTTTSPSFEVYRSWDRGRDYVWNGRRYYWDGTAWIGAPRAVYGYRGGTMGASSALNDDAGLNIPAEDTYVTHHVTRDVTRVEVEAPSLAVDVQRRLARRGYYHGPIDGVVGPGTRSAIAAYQADHGLRRDGMMTQEVVSSLGL